MLASLSLIHAIRIDDGKSYCRIRLHPREEKSKSDGPFGMAILPSQRESNG